MQFYFFAASTPDTRGSPQLYKRFNCLPNSPFLFIEEKPLFIPGGPLILVLPVTFLLPYGNYTLIGLGNLTRQLSCALVHSPTHTLSHAHK